MRRNSKKIYAVGGFLFFRTKMIAAIVEITTTVMIFKAEIKMAFLVSLSLVTGFFCITGGFNRSGFAFEIITFLINLNLFFLPFLSGSQAFGTWFWHFFFTFFFTATAALFGCVLAPLGRDGPLSLLILILPFEQAQAYRQNSGARQLHI